MLKRNTARMAVAAAALAGLAWPAAQALAQSAAYTSSPVDIYAGPSGDYPVVSGIGPGVPVTVMGCISDYSWCDVALPGLRGWVFAADLSYPYQGQYVPLGSYGPTLGLPIVGFSLGNYWGAYYRDRPWYGERQRWAQMPPRAYGGPPRPGMRAQEPGRPYASPGGVRPGEAGRPNEMGRPGEAGRPPEAGRPGGQPPGFAGGAAAPRPEGTRPPGQPGGGMGQRPMQPEVGRAPGGMRPGAAAGGERGFERGAPQMRAPGSMSAPGRGAAPQGGHPSGESGGRGGEGAGRGGEGRPQ